MSRSGYDSKLRALDARLNHAQRAELLEQLALLVSQLGLSSEYLAKQSTLIERTSRGSTGLSLRTLKRMRALTSEQITAIRNGKGSDRNFDQASYSRLRRLVAELSEQAETSSERDLPWYRHLCCLLGIKSESQQDFLRGYSGHYLCYRLTSMSHELLVTSMSIWGDADGSVRFKHLESIVADGPNARGRREIRHNGYAFRNGDRVQFLSVDGSHFRQISAILSTADDHAACSGVLMAMNLPHYLPFAARVYLEKVAEISAPEPAVEKLGVFDPTDPQYKRIAAYVRNVSEPYGSLLANDSI